ncbi:MAG: hypothetical protein ABUT20_11155 [Bacteroidota bacterium]
MDKRERLKYIKDEEKIKENKFIAEDLFKSKKGQSVIDPLTY